MPRDFSRIPAHADATATVQGEQNATGIPAAVRSTMEQAFGADFSQVRVHGESSRAAELGALAFTQGHHIHIARGKWAPDTTRGQEILGHELAHVLQQREGRVRPTVRVNGVGLNDDPTLEGQADLQGRLAAQFAAGPHPPSRPTGYGIASMPSRMDDVRQLLPEIPAATSPWWPPTQGDRTVVINDHDFDFKPGGAVDGPLSHNGTYKVLENEAKSFRMRITVGTNDAHDNDLDVTLAIKDGQATITGSVQGSPLEKAFTGAVSGAGTKSSPFSLAFTGKEGKKTTIVWRVDT